MKTEPLPILEPLILDFQSLYLGEFLTSIEFKRYCVQVNLEDVWRQAFKLAQNNRNYIALGMGINHDHGDSEDALVIIINHFYKNTDSNFYNFILDILFQFVKWSKKEINIEPFIKDLKLLKAPEETITSLEELGNYYSKPVPKTEIPDTIWNSTKLENAINKMDKSISNSQYNLTLTYAYSNLEGIYKAFIREKISDKIEENRINYLAKTIRDYLKKELSSKNQVYPEHVINLLPTITNALSSARNTYSESHFDEEAEKWLAIFSRDCVNSIGRMLLQFCAYPKSLTTENLNTKA